LLETATGALRARSGRLIDGAMTSTACVADAVSTAGADSVGSTPLMLAPQPTQKNSFG
jgi:hypothetical protein